MRYIYRWKKENILIQFELKILSIKNQYLKFVRWWKHKLEEIIHHSKYLIPSKNIISKKYKVPSNPKCNIFINIQLPKIRMGLNVLSTPSNQQIHHEKLNTAIQDIVQQDLNNIPTPLQKDIEQPLPSIASSLSIILSKPSKEGNLCTLLKRKERVTKAATLLEIASSNQLTLDHLSITLDRSRKDLR